MVASLKRETVESQIATYETIQWVVRIFASECLKECLKGCAPSRQCLAVCSSSDKTGCISESAVASPFAKSAVI
jgi:hypothetical protein